MILAVSCDDRLFNRHHFGQFDSAIMFHEVIEMGEADGLKMSAHDREEYRSAQIMLGFSLFYLSSPTLRPNISSSSLCLVWYSEPGSQQRLELSMAFGTDEYKNNFNSNEPPTELFAIMNLQTLKKILII